MKKRYCDRKKIMFCLLLLFVIGIAVIVRETTDQRTGRSTSKKKVASEAIEATSASATASQMPQTTAIPTPTPTIDPTEGVYTFLQGPKSWGSRLDWSGEWGDSMYDGGSFGGFGCGLCCLANIYSTETNYQCSPIDMYQYAKKQTEYGGGGAIAWEYMEQTLSQTGFTAKLCNKPDRYEEFQQKVKDSKCNIVLVSSADSDCYWKNTPGHYVTIFLYDAAKDQVFLADSGDPDHNRHWIGLKKIYKSLKTDSDYQYLSVTDYDQSKDQWKHTGTSGTWVKPDNI